MAEFINYFQDGDHSLPTILMLHGTGGDEKDLLDIAEFIGRDNPKLGIRGRIVEGGANRYFAHLPSGQFDLQSLQTESAALFQEVHKLAEEYKVDEDSMIMLGFSNGANVGLYAMLHKLTPIKRGIFMHAMALTDKIDPDASVGKVWMSHGILDPIVHERNFALIQKYVKNSGGQITTFEHNRGHEVTMEEIQDAKNWLDKLE